LLCSNVLVALPTSRLALRDALPLFIVKRPVHITCRVMSHLLKFRDRHRSDTGAVSVADGLIQCARRREMANLVAGDAIVHEPSIDRKSTRLNSSHGSISYAVFCLKK